MLRGRFGDTTKRPYLEGRLVIPRLNISSDISFLVDTGADRTTLLPGDSAKVGLNYHDLRVSPVSSVGIGGYSQNYVERAFVAFAEKGRAVHLYNIEMQIVKPKEELMRSPSLLGRDILNNWLMRYSPKTNRLTFKVITADHTLPIDN